MSFKLRSVKLWISIGVIALLTTLIACGLITDMTFRTLLGIVLGAFYASNVAVKAIKKRE